MEKLKTLLWILFVVGVLMYRFFKKMQETTARESRERPARPAPELPASSFEELLRQMQPRNADDTPEKTPAAPPKKRPQTPGGRPLPQARSQERTPRRQPSLEAPATAQSFQNTKPIVRRADTLPRAVVTAAHSTVAPAYQAVPPTEPVSLAVRRLLRQPADVRAAFVLSEIFQRRF